MSILAIRALNMFDFQSIYNEYGIWVMLFLAAFSFLAGFIDAVVGGGGLIIMPYLLINFPKLQLPVLFGTNKISALAGTSVSAIKYAQKIKFDLSLLFIVSFFAFSASFAGAKIVSQIDSSVLKPFILIVLIVIAVYTFFKKDLGNVQTKNLSFSKQAIYASLIGIVIGFYDGFFGPGTGSFLVLGFVLILGFEFVKASAYAKIINCITNLSALIVFIKNGQFIIELSIIMAVFTISGSYIGATTALRKGNEFIRKIFLVIVSIMILKYGYDVFSN
jgi:uncharacterized membrane protein YfcA